MTVLQLGFLIKKSGGRIYFDMIEAFESKDCDTLYEVLELDPVFDEVFENFHPEYEEDV